MRGRRRRRWWWRFVFRFLRLLVPMVPWFMLVVVLWPRGRWRRRRGALGLWMRVQD
jgi:hypothetical protein